MTTAIAKPASLPLAPEPPGDVTGLAVVIERLAANPDVDVAKLEKIIDLQERILQHNARAAFNEAYAEMQRELPVIVERGRTNTGKYAPLEDIVEIVRPIITRFGFALSHKTEWPDKETVRVVGILTHKQGAERTSEFLSSADESGNKNDIQGLGSAISYGRRYTTNDLLNIVTRGQDDNGRAAGKPPKPEPDGFTDWLLNLEATADNGLAALEETWRASKQVYRDHLKDTAPNAVPTLKAKAAKVKS